MAGLWQRTGNVTVTNGSKTITGFGTKWKTGTLPIQKGHTFYGPDNAAYEVDTVVSDESILLVDTYRGGTLANQAYRIDITRTSTISQFAADLASLVAKYRSWFDGMMTWLTGSGDVAILNPDTGANVTIPSWKKVASEGEGQAARAKTEADKAAASAALAGDIVVASALPLPDVWAPLSDSLRLITGYGRDVLVGSDVVARMVNFSRNTAAAYVGKDGQWKNAASNEPRFEREGLLIEGQSTNVFNKASGTNFSWLSEGLTQSAGTATLPFDVFQKTITSSTSNPTHIGRVMVDNYSTPNPAASGGGPVTASAIMFGDADAIIAADPKVSVSSNLTITGVTNSAVKLTSGMVRVVWTGIITAGSAANFVNFQLSWLNRLPSVVAGCYQIEALPFASSYIPTNGAAVTRAADVANLPQAQNIPDLLGSRYSIAARFTLKPGVSKSFRFLLRTGNILTESMGIVQRNSEAKLRAYQGSADLVNNTVLLPFIEGSSFVCGLGIRSGKVVGYSSVDRAVVANPSPFTPNSKMADFLLGDLRLMANYQPNNEAWGHIRDLRIWWQELSDAQWKVVS